MIPLQVVISGKQIVISSENYWNKIFVSHKIKSQCPIVRFSCFCSPVVTEICANPNRRLTNLLKEAVKASYAQTENDKALTDRKLQYYLYILV